MTKFPSVTDRRGFLTVGALTGVGITLADFLRMRQASAEQPGSDAVEAKADSVIHIYLPGGMAHQESFDPKPYAPVEYRGSLGMCQTKIPGEVFRETLPKTAAIADKITVIRSMSHGEAAHERGTHNMFTGYKPSPALQFPSMGSVVSHEYGPKNNLPPYMCIPNQPNEFAGSGYMSSSFAPFSLGADPANGGFKVQDLTTVDGVDDKRFDRRRSALQAINDYFTAKEKSNNLRAMDTFYDRAYSLVSSQKAREAFNIDAEPAALRDQYGRNVAGQRMLMARRLVEAGVRFVSLTYGGWDMHGNIAGGMQGQLPAFDQAFTMLVNDLDTRGLLKRTVIMVSSEFGRTPKINRDAGRDHWPKVFSVVLAGGGIKRGLIYGKSDPTAAEPEEAEVGPGDLAFTVYHCLGINADKKLIAPGNRPIAIVNVGKVVKGLLA